MKYAKGEEVFYLVNNKIESSTIKGMMAGPDDSIWYWLQTSENEQLFRTFLNPGLYDVTVYGNYRFFTKFPQDSLFRTKEELLASL